MKLIALVLLLIGVAIWWYSQRLRQSTGLPWREVVYQDTNQRSLTRPLFSARYRLTGQPDYILAYGDTFIPVEVKPTRTDASPRYGDILQLAAYCLLVEEWRDSAPPHGLLRYATKTFQITWDEALYNELVATLDQMRDDLQYDDVPRSHDQAWRCRACGFGDRCDQAL